MNEAEPSAPKVHTRKRLTTINNSIEGLCLLCDTETATSRWTDINSLHRDGENEATVVDLCIHCWKNLALADHTHRKRLLGLVEQKEEHRKEARQISGKVTANL